MGVGVAVGAGVGVTVGALTPNRRSLGIPENVAKIRTLRAKRPKKIGFLGSQNEIF